jgi:transcription elongation GreA/GreB family factor
MILMIPPNEGSVRRCVEKLIVIERIKCRLLADLESLRNAARASHEEAIHPSSKAENKYDTRGLEASYLADGQVKQALETEESIIQFQKLEVRDQPAGSMVTVGSLVRLESRGKQLYYFLGPRSGGLEIEIEGSPLLVITPAAPLGKMLLGKKVGDKFKLPQGNTSVSYLILSIQ